MSRLLTQKQVAERLVCSTRHVKRLRDDRKLESVKVGHLVRVSEEALAAYIDRNRTAAVEAVSDGDRVALKVLTNK